MLATEQDLGPMVVSATEREVPKYNRNFMAEFLLVTETAKISTVKSLSFWKWSVPLKIRYTGARLHDGEKKYDNIFNTTYPAKAHSVEQARLYWYSVQL